MLIDVYSIGCCTVDSIGWHFALLELVIGILANTASCGLSTWLGLSRDSLDTDIHRLQTAGTVHD